MKNTWMWQFLSYKAEYDTIKTEWPILEIKVILSDFPSYLRHCPMNKRFNITFT